MDTRVIRDYIFQSLNVSMANPFSSTIVLFQCPFCSRISQPAMFAKGQFPFSMYHHFSWLNPDFWWLIPIRLALNHWFVSSLGKSWWYPQKIAGFLYLSMTFPKKFHGFWSQLGAEKLLTESPPKLPEQLPGRSLGSVPVVEHDHLPSGKHTKNYGKSPFLIGKFTISMVIFNSYVTKKPEGMSSHIPEFISLLFITMNMTTIIDIINDK